MKKLLLFISLLVVSTANARFVQVTFDEGYFIQVENVVPFSPSQGSSTSDSSINSILITHNVSNCISGFSIYPNFTIFFNYTGTNISTFITDLNNNENVYKVGLCYELNNYHPTYSDLLDIKLISDQNGAPTSINLNGNIVTNNSELNIIFEEYNVKAMGQLLPNLTQYFQIYFEGDITELKTSLDNFDSVIEFSELIGVPMLLSNESFEKSTIQIYPNPFENNFTIQTEKTISNYSLSDLSGKKLINTVSKNEVDNLCSRLDAGVYFVSLLFQDGQKVNYKIVKK